VAEARLPDAIWKNCPWQPRPLIKTGLRQWLRCAGAALRDDQVIGMPSYGVDQAWHGFILCAVAYADFCDADYGRSCTTTRTTRTVTLSRRAPRTTRPALGRTVIAWSLMAQPGESCVLWDLDSRVGVEQPWGISPHRVEAVVAELAGRGLPPGR
jgi:hypothetical protein